jgi:uncharacterized protein YbjT (DUF2867 family)
MRVLVTGATGNIGRRVVDHLLAAGAHPVRALTVDPAKAALPPEVEVAVGYIGRAATLPAALEGVERMYLAPPPGPSEVLALAKQAGVQRVVDVSGPPETWWNHVRADVENSGLQWTHLWPGEFMENFTMWAPQIRRGDVVRDAYPGAANAAIGMDDIAAIAAKALLTDGHLEQSYLLTGPETLTRADRVRIIGEVLGRELRYEEVSRDEAIAELRAVLGSGAEWYVDLLPPSVEHPQPVDGTFARVMGRPATDFARWVATHADSFR